MTKKVVKSSDLNNEIAGITEMIGGHAVAVSIIFEEVNIFGASADDMKIRMTATEQVCAEDKQSSNAVKIVEEFEIATQVRKKFKSVEDILTAFSKEYFIRKGFNGDEKNQMYFFAGLVLGGSPIYDLEKYFNSPMITIKEIVR